MPRINIYINKKIKKNINIFVLILFMIFVTTACVYNESNSEQKIDVHKSTVTPREITVNRFPQTEESKTDIKIKQTNPVDSGSIETDIKEEKSVTVLIYMNGSNLESENEIATEDISEMISGAGVSDKVNIIVQTMGTKRWAKRYNIASDRTQRYKIDGTGIKLVDDTCGQLICTEEETLRDFVLWGKSNFPADRYVLIMWNHGGGPVYGFGYDEWDESGDSLTIDEIMRALQSSGIHFDLIGMDCCLMSSIETCMALYNSCDYAVLSEDFEGDTGWEYSEWISSIYKDTSIETENIGKIICNSSIDNSTEKTILATIDESMIKVLYTAWKSFAYRNEDILLSVNFSTKTENSGRGLKKKKEYYNETTTGNSTMEDYYITDMLSVSCLLESEESELLNDVLKKTLVYVKTNDKTSVLTGISVTLPYEDRIFYEYAKDTFENIGMDSAYVTWLNKFTKKQNRENLAVKEETEPCDDNYWDW